MSGRRNLTFVVAGAVLLMMTASAWADRKITEAEVPKAVLDAVKAAVPQAQFASAKVDEHHQGVRYEVNVKDGDTRVHLHVTADGKVTWLARDYAWDNDVAIEQIPPVVKEALLKLRPNAEILEAETGHHHGKLVYEIEIKGAGKDDEEIHINEAGEVVKIKSEHRD
jgi:uncharacterized membrane protein YkoI